MGFEASADYRLYRLLAERVGIERLRHCENAVEQLRLIKDEQELEQIRRSVALNSLVFQETVALLRPGGLNRAGSGGRAGIPDEALRGPTARL